jgi:hypothetical protein
VVRALTAALLIGIALLVVAMVGQEQAGARESALPTGVGNGGLLAATPNQAGDMTETYELAQTPPPETAQQYWIRKLKEVLLVGPPMPTLRPLPPAQDQPPSPGQPPETAQQYWIRKLKEVLLVGPPMPTLRPLPPAQDQPPSSGDDGREGVVPQWRYAKPEEPPTIVGMAAQPAEGEGPEHELPHVATEDHMVTEGVRDARLRGVHLWSDGTADTFTQGSAEPARTTAQMQGAISSEPRESPAATPPVVSAAGPDAPPAVVHQDSGPQLAPEVQMADVYDSDVQDLGATSADADTGDAVLVTDADASPDIFTNDFSVWS